MFLQTKITALTALLMSVSAFASNNPSTIDLTKNGVNVNSVTERFATDSKEIELIVKNKIEDLMAKYCNQEIEIFCPKGSDKYICLKNNYNLLTGQCRELMSKEFGKGIKQNRLVIHDLRLAKNTLLLKTEKREDSIIGTYSSENEFIYRNIPFRKGDLQVRNYLDFKYEGQFVIYSGYPKASFKDSANITYNPFFQKTPFFFDEKGRVTVGSLGKDYEYKTHIIFKRGTIIAFDENRKLVRGILKHSVRYGRCTFLKEQEIKDSDLEKCMK